MRKKGWQQIQQFEYQDMHSIVSLQLNKIYRIGKFYNEALSTTIFTVKLTAGPLVLWPLLYECIAM